MCICIFIRVCICIGVCICICAGVYTCAGSCIDVFMRMELPSESENRPQHRNLRPHQHVPEMESEPPPETKSLCAERSLSIRMRVLIRIHN